MNKRILALAIALLMACSSLAFADGEAGIAPILGFGGEWASGSWGVSQLPLSDGDPIHVSCMFPRQSGHPISLDDTWWAKELLKRANVVIDWTLVEKAGFQDKKNLVLASGDYPDIFMDGITKVDEQTYGPQGVFVNLAPLIEEYAPNTCELFKMYPDVKKSLSYPDGAIYNMCDFNITPRDQFCSAPYYNKAWVENLGMKQPTTLEELYDVLLAVKEKDADGDGDPTNEIPLLYPDGSCNNFKTAVLAGYGLMALVDDQGVMADFVKDGAYLFVPVQEGYRDYLTYMNRLYTAGIITDNNFTYTGEQVNAKIADVDVFMMEGAPYGNIVDDEDWIDSYDMLPFLSSERSSEKIWPATLRHTRAWGNFVMTDACKYPVEMVKLQDYFYTDVGSMMVRAGRERYTYDEYGWEITVDEATGDWTAAIYYDKDNFNGYYAWRLYNSPLQGTYVAGEFQNKVMICTDYKNNWYSNTKMNTGRSDYMQIPYPEVTFTQDEQDTLMVYVDIANYVNSMEAKFIRGEVSIEDGWDSYVDTIENMGLQDIIDVKQAAYDRWNLN
mgnify:CR=1 FL=1